MASRESSWASRLAQFDAELEPDAIPLFYTWEPGTYMHRQSGRRIRYTCPGNLVARSYQEAVRFTGSEKSIWAAYDHNGKVEAVIDWQTNGIGTLIHIIAEGRRIGKLSLEEAYE